MGVLEILTVRNRKHGDLGAKPLEEFIGEIHRLVQAKVPAE